MSSYSLSWGRKVLNFNLPDSAKIFTIETKPGTPIKNFPEQVREALSRPVGTPALKQLVKPGDKVAIVTSDITRLAYRTDAYLPVIIDVLREAGIKNEDLTIVMANGTHRVQTPAEHCLIVGEKVFGRLKIVDHNCRSEDLVRLGKTSYGTEVTVNRIVYEADKVVLTGGISYHILAGFGGGRKSLAAGVCGYKTIQQNHSLALSNTDGQGINPYVTTGIIKENPVARDMMEIARMIGADFIVNVIVNENKEFIGLVAGDLEQAFDQGCRVVEEHFSISVGQQADWVIASCGGYPKDIQLYQSMKALENAACAVKRKGVIVLLSECSDGVGSDDFISWFQYPNIPSMREALGNSFSMPGFIALRTANIIDRSPVILISSLPEDLIRKVGMHPAVSMEKALLLAKQLAGHPATIALMPQGAITYPVYTNSN